MVPKDNCRNNSYASNEICGVTSAFESFAALPRTTCCRNQVEDAVVEHGEPAVAALASGSQNEVFSGSKHSHQPAEQVPKACKHGRNPIRSGGNEEARKSLKLQPGIILANDNSKGIFGIAIEGHLNTVHFESDHLISHVQRLRTARVLLFAGRFQL